MVDYVSEDSIKGILIDIGYNEDQVINFMENYKKGDLKKILSFLSIERCQILEGVHQEEKKICNLDYLVYVLEKEFKQ